VTTPSTVLSAKTCVNLGKSRLSPVVASKQVSQSTGKNVEEVPPPILMELFYHGIQMSLNLVQTFTLYVFAIVLSTLADFFPQN